MRAISPRGSGMTASPPNASGPPTGARSATRSSAPPRLPAADPERPAAAEGAAPAVVARQRLADGDEDRARSAAERLIARDPLREEAHEVLIAVHGMTGTRSQVVRQYRRLCDVLDRELAEVPLPETDATDRPAL